MGQSVKNDKFIILNVQIMNRQYLTVVVNLRGLYQISIKMYSEDLENTGTI